ncbi:MAG: hypothetical protein M3019_00365 [Candidatus Dormibacteraeota bacterium]|nr:hypothetical protein [Candidatus Dormibacteraeota bacterium]
MSEETPKPDQATSDENAKRTHEGNAHADHEETAEESRGAIQRWGSSSPGGNTLDPTGDSPPSDADKKLPNEN